MRSTFFPGVLFLLLTALLTVLPSAFAQVPLITRGPYLQSVTTSNIIVRWRTDVPTESRVRYGNTSGNLVFESAKPELVTEHSVTLPGLTPETRYFYSITAGVQVLVGGPAYTFLTPPSVAKATRIWALGDVGTASLGSTAPYLVRNAYASYTGTRPTDVWLMLGDNAYYSGTDSEYQTAVFGVFQEMLRTTPVWSTLGNHETYSAVGGRMAYDDIFDHPVDGRAGGVPSGTERYYSFNHANIHFVCLDSELSSRQPGSPMLTWLEQDLVANEKDWTIAFWHSPPYSKGTHDSDAEINLIDMRERVVPILESYGADLILCGHSHNYERSFLLNGHYGHSSSLQPSMVLDSGGGRPEDSGAYLKSTSGSDAGRGAVYVVAGSSGQTGFGSFNHPAVFKALNNLGSMVIDVNGNRLEARFLRENGVVDDHFTILKGDQPPFVVTQPQNRTVVEGATVNLSVVAGGTRPLGYQWLYEGSPLAGASNAILSLPNVQATQAGGYSVMITNQLGAVTSVVAQLVVNPAPICVPPSTGIISWWPLDGNAEDTVGGWNGALVGVPSFVDGIVDYGLLFDGADDQVEVAYSSPMDLGLKNGFTIELWIKPSSIESPQPLFEWNNRQGSVGLQFWIAQPNPAGNGPGSLFASLTTTSGVAHWIASPANVLKGNDEWNHVALTYDKETGICRLFANGEIVREAQVGSVTVLTSYDLFIGRRVAVSGDNYRYAGAMDELAMYDHALPPSDIQSIAEAGSAGKCKAPVAPRITKQPESRVVAVGGNVDLLVSVQGTRPLSYQWFFGDEPILGADGTNLMLTDLQLSDGGDYTVVISNVAGFTLSQPATLTILASTDCASPPAGLVSWWPFEGDGFDIEGSNHVAIIGGAAFGGGKVGAAMYFDGVDDQGDVLPSTTLDIGKANGMSIELWINPDSVDVQQPLLEWNDRQGSVGVQFWIAQPPPAGSGSGSLFASMVEIGGSTVWVASPPGLLTNGGWQHVALTYDKQSGLSRFYLNGAVVYEENVGQRILHTTYDLFIGRRVAVSGDNFRYSGGMDEVSVYNRPLEAGEIQAIVASGQIGKCRIPRPPVILIQPDSQTVTEGDTARLSVVVGGSAPFRYQWHRNEVPISNATNATLVISNSQIHQSGSYTVEVVNNVGTNTSEIATLTVVFPPAQVRIGDAQGSGGSSVEVPVLLRANGNENALGFSVQFDPQLLQFSRVEAGPDAPSKMTVVANPASAAAGRVGLAVALSPGIAFNSGTQSFVKIVFTAAPVLTAVSTPLSFGDNPTVRQISDREAAVLAGTFVGGNVVLFPTDFEGDTAPRPDGDRGVTIIDWVQMGRFVAGLNSVGSSNEFQRADSAPRSTRGNGVIGVTDWVQTGRYAAGLDPATPVSGPIQEVAASESVRAAAASERVIHLVDSLALPGTTSNVPVNLLAQGNENALGFSVSFDATQLQFAGAMPGSAASGAVLNINESEGNVGRIGVALALPAGATFGAGEREVVVLRFFPIGNGSDATILEFGDVPVRREVSDALAEPLVASYVSGTVGFPPAGPPLNLNLSGGISILSWPALETEGYELESTTDLGSAVWVKVDVQPIVIGGQRIVTVPVVGNQAWYRLRKP